MSQIDPIDVPGYRIVSRIMAGGMATVYIAEQLKLGSRRVAIKIFRSRNPDDARTDHTAARNKRFAQEAMIARNLQHPHVVQVFDYGSGDDFQFLVMEYLAHGDLKQRIRAGMQPPQILKVLQQVASALALLHRHGIVHRDIKPANILFREPEHAVLADFGIARSIDQNTQLTNTGFILGTPSYMSPEQINGGSIGAQTDIYALGVLFYEMLTGNLPYRGDSVQSVATQHLMAPVPNLPLEVRKLQPLLNRLMAKKSAQRMADGSELLQALSRLDFDRSFAVKPPSFAQLHARKIAAVAGLMGCSVAVTWAGIARLPYWLDIATSQPTITQPTIVQQTMEEPPAGKVFANIDPVLPPAELLQSELSPAVMSAPEAVLVPESSTLIETAPAQSKPIVAKAKVAPSSVGRLPKKFAEKIAANKSSAVGLNNSMDKVAVSVATKAEDRISDADESQIGDQASAMATGVAQSRPQYMADAVQAAVVNDGAEVSKPASSKTAPEPTTSAAATSPAEPKTKLPPVISFF